ncbi:SusC/RagA family TonB-linked outer membrane protein [Proteiniphilum sp. X52]|uniref:SusC/RagA family TonB-linked outer membrane protein n=1 Tax=Proteiniphilum sp. X52 TaxID=2382159 RepID=UPI000F09D432|nr:SusC/RagA family TonB-linked outer membrane protein [Proteiniphilum sp. X52]RNC64674.1 SusC/RagA family TonB-linked outer membrane protein [Proteiniphilum sp. X52]
MERMIRKLFLVSTCLLLLSIPLFGQDTSVRQGIVVDKVTRETLPGVQVIVKGTFRGGVTDVDGVFKIEADEGDYLAFSMLGYEPEEVHVGSSASFNVELTPTAYDLGEVVVTALGIERKTRTLAYSTQKIDGSIGEIKDNSSNILSSLSGKISGAVITTAATGPGAAARVVLRGNRSISGNNTALIVIDGVPYDNTSYGQATGTTYNYGGSDGAVNINPDDVASINVLKGPSAAALYGSRAANGAIIITTKKGKEGRLKIDFNSGMSVDNPHLLIDFQNKYGRGNGGVAAQGVGESWGEEAPTYSSNVKDFFETAYSFNNTVSLYGGTEMLQGFASYTNNSVEGMIPGNKLERNTMNLRVNTRFHSKLTTDAKITYVNQKVKNRPRLGDAGTPIEAYIMPRDMSGQELMDYETINPNNGQPVRKYWTTSSIYDNPYWSVHRTSVNEERNRVTLLGSAKYQVLYWLSVLARVSYDRYDDKVDGSFYDGTVSLGDVKPGGKYYETNSRYWERNFDFLLSGENAIAGHISLNYNLGASLLKREYATVTDMANGLSIPNKFSLAAATTPAFQDVGGYTRALNSVYGNLQMGFKSYLFVDVTGRNDWSSTLPSPHSYFYPSAGLSAIVSDMVKMPSWIDFGKIRASYTVVGNDPDPYLLKQRFKFALGAGQGFISRDQIKSIQGLKPEKTKSYEAGMEWRFFRGRLDLDITLYKSNTVNQLLYVGLPMASGFNRRYINAGNIENRGLEIQLNAMPIDHEFFKWNTGVNFSRNINKVIELAPNTSQVNITDNTKYATVIVKEGSAYGDLYGRAWKKHETTGKPVVDDRGLPVIESNQKLGNFNPDAMLGWSNTLKYKAFKLSFLVDARIGGEMVSGTDAYLAAYGVAGYTEKFREGSWVLDAVKADGSANTTAITSQQLWTTVSQNGRDAWGDFFTYDMTNVRLRDLSVGYDFKLNEKAFIEAASLSLTGRNLLFFYRGKSVMNIHGIGKRDNPADPDASLGAGNYQGVELGLPPLSRSIGLNLKLTF